MNNISLDNFFTRKSQNLISKIYDDGLDKFKMTKIEFEDDTYYFKKTSENTLTFCKLDYETFTEKAYIRPIALIFNDEAALINPTIYEFYNGQTHSSYLDIGCFEDSEAVLIVISSLEIIDVIYRNKPNLLNGNTITAEVGGVSFLISELYNKLNFHSTDGNIHYGSYNYKIEKYTNQMILENFSFNDEFNENVEILKKLKFIANANEISLD